MIQPVINFTVKHNLDSILDKANSYGKQANSALKNFKTNLKESQSSGDNLTEKLTKRIGDLNDTIKKAIDKMGDKKTESGEPGKIMGSVKKVEAGVKKFLSPENLSLIGTNFALKQISQHLTNLKDQAIAVFQELKNGFDLLVVDPANVWGDVELAITELQSLGFTETELIYEQARKFSNEWSGTTAEGFIKASYDIKSGISVLSDAMVGEFTKVAGITAKATKASIEQMTAVISGGYNVYSSEFQNAYDYVNKFSGLFSSSVKLFKTDGVQMSDALRALGSAAKIEGVSLLETVNILASLQLGGDAGSAAATKYAAFFRGAKASQSKLGLDFTNEQGQLRSAMEIIEILRGKYGDTLEVNESVDIKKAFGDESAVAFVNFFYNRVEETLATQEQLNASMQEGINYSKQMADINNSSVSSLTDLLNQSIENLKAQLGKRIDDSYSSFLNNLIENFNNLQNAANSSHIDSLANSIGSLLESLSFAADEIFQVLPGLISNLSIGIEYLALNIDNIIAGLKFIIPFFIGSKIFTYVYSLVTQAKLFWTISKSVWGMFSTQITKIASWILPFLKKLGWVNVVAGVILTIVNLIGQKLFGFDSFLEIIMGFVLYIGYGLEIIFNKMLDIGRWASKFIPFVGDNLMGWFDEKIDNSLARLDTLKNSIENLKADDESIEQDVFIEPELEIPEMDLSDGVVDFVAPPLEEGVEDAIEDTLSKISDKYSLELDYNQSKIDLAESQENQAKVDQMIKERISILNRQRRDILDAINTASGDDYMRLKTELNQLDTDLISLRESLKKTAELMGEIDDIYDPQQSLIDSKIDLAEHHEQHDKVDVLSREKISLLQDQIDDYTDLMKIVTEEPELQKIETEKNKLILQILQITDEINNRVGELVGEFNLPSQIGKMSQYEYILQGKDAVNKLYGKGNNIEVVFNLNGLETPEIKQKIDELANYLGSQFNKNDLVSYGMNDVIRG